MPENVSDEKKERRTKNTMENIKMMRTGKKLRERETGIK